MRRDPVALSALRVEGYRSIRSLRLGLGPLAVITGPNGCGKTNLYRALTLVTAAARGGLARALVAEGGMPSVLWAGPKKKGPVRLAIGLDLGAFRYELECGLPVPDGSAFERDPSVKVESISFETDGRRVVLLERRASSCWALDEEGRKVTFPYTLDDGESVLSEVREPHRFPHLSALRQEVLAFRFYHHFRVDADAPARQPQVAVRTMVLSEDGHDLVSALESIRESGGATELDGALADLLPPGARVEIEPERPEPRRGGVGRLRLEVVTPGLARPLELAELSDGTVKFLCLAAALLTPRPPRLLALNEPEMSLHPDRIEALARLVVEASRRSQVWVTTHSEALVGHVARLTGVAPIELAKVDGETKLAARLGEVPLERAPRGSRSRRRPALADEAENSSGDAAGS